MAEADAIRFIAEHGVTYAVELEALDPKELQAELDAAIRSHLDVDLFNQEVAREKEEAGQHQALKNAILKVSQEFRRAA